MSRANITSMTPLPGGGGAVVFALRAGGERTYYYDDSNFAAILAGSDPKDFSGSDSPLSGGAAMSGEIGTSLGEAVIDIAELGAL